MVDRRHIGRSFGPTTHVVEMGRLRFFAKATGDGNPVYPASPIPPTFSFCLELDRDDPFDFLRELDIDLARILHAEQSFEYHALIQGGETITFTSQIADVYDKKGGALSFVAVERQGCKPDGSLAVVVRTTLVVRNG